MNRTRCKCKWKWALVALLLVFFSGLTGCRQLEKPAGDHCAFLNIDTANAVGEWNKVWQSQILDAGTYYKVEIPYQIQNVGEDAWLYAVVAPEDDPGHTLASVRWRSDHLKTQQFSFYLPENETNSCVVLGMHKKGRASVGDIAIRKLPPIGPDVVAFVEDPGYSPYGVCAHLTRWPIWGPEAGFTDEQVRQSLRDMAAAGIQWIRIDANWVIVEEKEGIYDEVLLRRTDDVIQWAADNGIQVYLQLGGQPQWASTQPDAPDFWAYRTDRMQEFRDYVAYVTQRYKGKVQYWEVGNEVDWVFWKDSLVDYVNYLKAASDVIRKTDPQNRIILGSMAFDGTHVWSPQKGAEEDALRRLYELGIKPYFDVLGVHCYPLQTHNSLYEVVSAINQICSAMEEFSDADKPVWLTESGYSTGREKGGTLELQAEYLRVLYMQIIAHPKIEKIFWYNWRCKVDEGDYENNFGLVNNDFSDRPAFEIFRTLKKFRLKPVNNTMLPKTGK